MNKRVRIFSLFLTLIITVFLLLGVGSAGAQCVPGSLDASFDGDGMVVTPVRNDLDVGTATALQPDGKIVVAGYSFNGTNHDFAVVRYHPDGSLDSSFDDDGKVTTGIGAGDDEARAVAIQPDGKIVVAGGSNIGTVGNAHFVFAVVRYNPDGSLDLSFDGDGKVTTSVGTSHDFGNAVAIQSDGNIVVAGDSLNGSNYQFAVVRYTPIGTLDSNFGGEGFGKLTTDVGPGNDFGNAVAIQPDGKILVAGSSETGPSFETRDFAVVRYDPFGLLDPSFSGDGIVTTDVGALEDRGTAMAIQPDGKIVVAGYSFNGTNQDFAVVRYNPDGSLDPSFSGDAKVTTDVGADNDAGTAVAIQPDGKIVVTGHSTNGPIFPDDFAIVRYNPDGSLDLTFDGDGKVTTDVGGSFDFGTAMAIQPDGKIVVAGYSSNGTNFDFAVVRYHGDCSSPTPTPTPTPTPNPTPTPGPGSRVISFVGGTTVPGNQVAASVQIAAQGDENSVSFSLSYDSAFLSDPVVSLGSAFPDATLFKNTATAGQIGVLFAQPDNTGIPAGTQTIVTVTFNTVVTSAASTPVAFGDVPTARGVANLNADTLTAIWQNGFVTFAHGLEADVADRPAGNGVLSATDATQVGRFVAGLDAVDPSYNEFQRADSAPRSTLGDGVLTAADYTQVRRYITGLDTPVSAGGPGAPSSGGAFSAATKSLASFASLAATPVYVANVNTSAGSQVTVPIIATAQGIENAFSFSVDYNASILTNPVVTKGADTQAASLTSNTLTPGKIGVVFGFDVPSTISAGTREILKITFTVASNVPAGATPVTFSDSPTFREISDAEAQAVESSWTGGSVNILAPTSAPISISGRVIDGRGRGIKRARMTVTDMSGNVRVVLTNAFGYYRFDDLEAGTGYIVSVDAKRYTFEPPSIFISAVDDVSDLNFVGEPLRGAP